MSILTGDVASRLLDAIPDAVLLVDRRGVLVWVNEQAHRMLGYTPGELVGASVETLLPAAQRGAHAQRRARFHAAPTTRRMGGDLHLNAVRKDASLLPVDISLAPFEHSGEDLVVAVVRDLSDRRRLERQLHEAQRLESVGRLAGGVAHDFNNALGIILGISELARETLSPDSQLSQDLADILTAASHAAAVTRQLLAFSRKQLTSPQPILLDSVITEASDLVRRMLGAAIPLAVHLAPDLGVVMADPTQLTQILFNLVVNARDAMPGGGQLTIETANAELDEAYAATHHEVSPGSYVLLSVSDTGTGMDADTLAHVFEPFFTTKEGKGFGLGLASVHGIVKQAGGHIWIYSEVGAGTTFKIYLPRIEAHASPSLPVTGAAPAGGHETILVVDDASLMRITVATILRRRGYSVLVAASPAEARELCAAHGGPIDLLVTDVVMPDGSGRRLAEDLVRMRPSLRVLYMSGYTENAIVHQGVIDPDVALISKPFTAGALAARVRELLDAPSRLPECREDP